ncbi:MAG TPA: PHP domain-containing protein [Chthoniobacterales bacterium]|nr:PHP domain-containing protein [Chthoniobacterales bacterium]
MAPVTNADLAELLALESRNATGVLQRALKRAARAAFLWPEEAVEVYRSGGRLTELHGVGPRLASIIANWIENAGAGEGESDPLREDFLTLADARRILANDPAWSGRALGDLQMHTAWSDGSGSVCDMAAAAVAHGHRYIAITDHSVGLKIAGGIGEDELLQQQAEIAEVNASLAAAGNELTVLRSIELNLNPRGEGDMSSESLARLDLVLGSFHSSLRKKEDQTERYLAALRNPDLHILGHPRGRVYNFRIGLQGDWPRVFAEAATLDRAVEIDCYPDRQDLNVELLRLVREAGARVSLGTDAHDPAQFGFIELGLAAALRAGIPAERIINFLPLPDLLAWVKRLRDASPRLRKRYKVHRPNAETLQLHHRRRVHRHNVRREPARRLSRSERPRRRNDAGDRARDESLRNGLRPATANRAGHTPAANFHSRR